MARAPRIAIIVGGIRGLTAARALLRRGFEVHGHESTSELKEIGAAVALAPNAMKALRALNIEDAVRRVAFESEYAVARNWRTSSVISRARVRSYMVERFAATGCTVHRADLLIVLADGLPAGIVHLGGRCVGVSTDSTVASARFTNGTEIDADAIVGADGIHSAVRESLSERMHRDSQARFAGALLCRSTRCRWSADD